MNRYKTAVRRLDERLLPGPPFAPEHAPRTSVAQHAVVMGQKRRLALGVEKLRIPGSAKGTAGHPKVQTGGARSTRPLVTYRAARSTLRTGGLGQRKRPALGAATA